MLVHALLLPLLTAGLGRGYCGYKQHRNVRGRADTAQRSRDRINAPEIRLDELSSLLDDEDMALLAGRLKELMPDKEGINCHAFNYSIGGEEWA